MVACMATRTTAATLQSEAGAKPIVVFAGATVLNLALAFVLASILFAGFRLSG